MAVSFTDTAAVNPNEIKALLANGLSTFHNKGNQVFSNGFKSIPESPPDCPTSWIQVVNNFKLADEPFAKALQSFKIVNNNLCGKLFLSLESPIKFDETFKVTSVPFFIPDLIY